MSEGNSVINVGDLTKPVNTLIEKISDAIGVLYEPTYIVRKAKAEVKAQEIMTFAELKTNEIKQRALTRFIHEEIRKQENIESIIEVAIPQISPSAKSENIENDWLVKFFENAKLISDKDMQALWAKLLAGETNNPGTFSKRTINLVAELDKKDADLFVNLCKFSFILGGNELNTIIFDHRNTNTIYTQYAITYETLLHLDNTGLIRFDGFSSTVRTELPKHITVFYFETPIHIEFPMDGLNDLHIGFVVLSQSGKELARICGAIPEERIRLHTIKEWQRQDLIITE